MTLLSLAERTKESLVDENFLRGDPITGDRYYAKAFMEKEWEHMWTRTWHVGGTVAQLPEPGCVITTEVRNESILMVRGDDNSIRAFYNVCQHRGNRMVQCEETKVKRLVCNYHSWCYGLNGSLLIALHLSGRQPVVSELMLSLYYLGFAAALGAMLAGWARANLDIALARSAALEVERDRSTVLLQRLIRAEEDERKRLAEDLHDRMGAGLFYLQHALDEFVQRTCGDPQGVRQVESMQRELAKCSADVRTLMNDLRPTVLDHFGLCEALSEYLTSLVGSVPFAIETRFAAQLQGWRSKQDVTLFRLTQEALLNVRKHAQATRVEVSLDLSDGTVVLSVRDNGCGMTPETMRRWQTDAGSVRADQFVPWVLNAGKAAQSVGRSSRALESASAGRAAWVSRYVRDGEHVVRSAAARRQLGSRTAGHPEYGLANI